MKSLPRRGVLGALLALDRRPLGVPAHAATTPRLITIDANRACSRRSDVSSGWNDGDHDRALASGDGGPVERRDHLDAVADPLDPRRADEDAVHRQVLAGDPDRRLEARHLAAVGVPAHVDVDQAEVPLVGPPVDRSRGPARSCPAHVPKSAPPRRCRSRIGSSRPYASISLDMVVDSPPGITSPSSAVQVGRRRAPRPRPGRRRERPAVLAEGALKGEDSRPTSHASAAGRSRRARRSRCPPSRRPARTRPPRRSAGRRSAWSP